jgi:CO/xanthine dehydrogenase Mo-binding subunit
MNILPTNMRFGAGQPIKRLEDQRLLTGKGQFIDDKPADGALWLYVLRSPHAHANITSIDTEAAATMAGVEAVYTGADLIADNIGTLPTLAVFRRRLKRLLPKPRMWSRSISSASVWSPPRWSRAAPLPKSTKNPGG